MLVVMLVVYMAILGTAFTAFAKLVRTQSEDERGNEGIDLGVNIVLTLGDEDPVRFGALRGLWRRVHNSRVRRLSKGRRVQANGRRTAVSVLQWD